jgi:hypothetical protein
MNRLFDLLFGLNRNKPVFTFTRYGDVFGCPYDLTAFEKANPSDFGQIDAVAIYLESLR